jgi:hypothetical protein
LSPAHFQVRPLLGFCSPSLFSMGHPDFIIYRTVICPSEEFEFCDHPTTVNICTHIYAKIRFYSDCCLSICFKSLRLVFFFFQISKMNFG